MKHLLTALTVLSITISTVTGQNDTTGITGKIFRLGEVIVKGEKPIQSVSVIRKDEIIKNNYRNIAEALRRTPGVFVSNTGARNENTVFLRGYDTRQISLLIDGIPVYIPYDGNVDLGRYLSWNYEKITISKGFSSMLYGPNTMGGVINLVTAVPEESWEMSAGADVEFGNRGYNGNGQKFRIGSRMGKFFYQGTFARNDLENWDLSDNYKSTNLQEEGDRINSFEEDLGFSLRLGYEPGEDQSYVISYSYQDGNKGIPVYDGDFSRKRYWRMPEWDKRNLYFNSKTKLAEDFKLISRLFYDEFNNTLESYDDETFSTQNRNYAFTSIYNDDGIGGSLRLINSSIEDNEISFATIYKRDNHRESAGGEQTPVVEIEDNILTLAVEDQLKINDFLSLTGGLSWNLQKNSTAKEYLSGSPDDAIYYLSGKDQALNYRIGLFLTFSENQNIWLNTSLKSRFATMKERYSYRLGRIMPNPDLGSESARHVNLGYRYNSSRFGVNTEFFYSAGKDIINYVNLNPDTLQYQNIEKTRSFGLDAQISYRAFRNLILRIDYGYLQIENPQDPDFYFINIPDHNLRLSGEYKFGRIFSLLAVYNYVSRRYSYSDGSFPVEGYGLTDVNFITEFMDKELLLRLSAKNIFDVNYFYSEGYPARGRTINIGILLNMQSR